jgi:diadenosine tetraphosphate (Ap4A) HIT family hydrolase
MNDIFHLDPMLTNDSFLIKDLNLSRVLLMNNSLFPWIILVPKRNNLREIIDLTKDEQIILMEEIDSMSKAMIEIFSPDKLNIAALGNIVEQLHIHIVVRYKHDLAWPQPVFGNKQQEYSSSASDAIITKFTDYFK